MIWRKGMDITIVMGQGKGQWENIQGVSIIWAVRDLYFRIVTALYRFRYTLLQVLIPSYRYRHCRVIHYLIYCDKRLHNSCRMRLKVLSDDKTSSIDPYI